PRQTIKGEELDDVRDEDLAVRRADVVVVGLDRDVHPILEVVGPVLRIDRANVSLVEEDQRPPDGGDLHRLEYPIETEYVSVEHIAPVNTRRVRLFPELIACSFRRRTSYNGRSCKNSSFGR